MSDDASLQQGQDGKQRTLLRTFSNSFKKGTANLRRGLTPRSRTSSQTDELGEAVPPAPVPTAASAPPKVLDNQVEHQVHVKIAEVDGVPKVQIASNEPASQQAPEQAKREEKAEQAKREGKAEQAKTEEKAPAAGETKPATDVKPAAETKPAPAPPAGAPPPLPASDPPAPSPAAEDVPTPDKAEHKVEPSGASVPAPDTPKQPSAPEFSHAPPTPLGPAHAAGQSEPAEAAGERVAAAARGEPLTHEVDPPEPAAPEPVERALEPAPFASGEAGATPLDRDSTVKAVDSELQYAAEAPKKEAGRGQVDFSKVAKAVVAAAVLVAGAVAAKRHFDTVPEEEEVEEPAPVARSKGFWQRG